MTALLNPKVWIAIALVAFLAFTHAFVYRAGRAAVRNQWDAQKLVDAENRILADKAQRTEEQRKQLATNQEINDAHAKEVKARADVAIANAAAGKLRGQLTAYIAAVRRAGQDSSAPAGSTSQPSADPLDLLAELYSRSDQGAGEIAEFADAAFNAGNACERISDRLQPPAR